MVNSSIHLRRPLLVTGAPGTGKSSLAYLIARELGLGPVLRWPVSSRTTLSQGLFLYDAIARVQAAAHEGEPDIGEFIHLGPLGTALLAADLPRVLLIDELDKGDIDLPNDLLNVFEEGEYEIPELVRYSKRQAEVTVLTHDRGHTATVHNGLVRAASSRSSSSPATASASFPLPSSDDVCACTSATRQHNSSVPWSRPTSTGGNAPTPAASSPSSWNAAARWADWRPTSS
ncbi:AAA family ATPase [Lentzea cavernae]|nr:MoxR family ATPase [Lentzea cavernae]